MFITFFFGAFGDFITVHIRFFFINFFLFWGTQQLYKQPIYSMCLNNQMEAKINTWNRRFYLFIFYFFCPELLNKAPSVSVTLF